VNILLLAIAKLFDTTTNLHSSALIVRAIGTRDQLTVSVITRKPALNVILSDSSIIKSTRYNVDDLIRESKTLVKLLSSKGHLFLHGLTCRQVTFDNHKLLNLFELMDSKYAPRILST